MSKKINWGNADKILQLMQSLGVLEKFFLERGVAMAHMENKTVCIELGKLYGCDINLEIKFKYKEE